MQYQQLAHKASPAVANTAKDKHIRVGLVSDTHVPAVVTELPVEVEGAFQGVDLILHAGDIYSLSVLDRLERIAPVLAAFGDDDDPSALLDRRVQRKHVLTLGGVVVWLLHDRSAEFWTNYRPTSGETDYALNKPQVIVFGHEHEAIIHQRDGVLWVNPSSPTFAEYRTGLGTIGVLDIGCGQARVSINHL